MDFIDLLKQFSARAEKIKDQLKTEEATKNALIMPFFQQIFGYDVFNPEEFIPEFVADVGVKKGEKVDYAIILNGTPTILVEAKSCNENLNKHNGQLFRYFGTTTAKFGILTNGIIWRFFTDLDAPNKMDLNPFLELDLLNIKESIVPELKRFVKSNFNTEELFNRAADLKYANNIKNYFLEQLKEPSADFVSFFLAKTYEGKKSAQVIEKFTPLVKMTLNNLISELMNERITSALKVDNVVGETELAEVNKNSKIVTTEEELSAFNVIKAMIAGVVKLEKVTYKDTVDYFAVLYDNMPTRWICRFYFNGKKKYVVFPGEKEQLKYQIDNPDDIFMLKEDVMTYAKRAFRIEEPTTV